MRILLDFTQIPLDRTGVGVYADNLVAGLCKSLLSGDELIVLVQRNELTARTFAQGRSNVIIHELPLGIFRNRICLLMFEQLLMPFLLAWLKVDVAHSLHYTFPLLARCRKVVTIHDLTFIRFPELHTRNRRWIMPFFIRRAMRQAEAVIFVSKATRTDAESLISIGNNIRAVVPLGVDVQAVESSASDLEVALERLGVAKPFLLFVGTIEPRKNIKRIVQAFEQIAHDYTDLKLVVVGKLGWHYESTLSALDASPFKNRIQRLGFISERDKKILFTSCSAVVYPSLYEGFGLPVLEGMAAGAAVITSNVSSLPEVSGDAAICIDPYAVDAIAHAMRQILDDPARRNRMIALGRARAAEFPWKLVADRTYAIYRRVAEK